MSANVKSGMAAIRAKMVKRRTNKNLVKDDSFFSVQLLSAEPTGSTQKYKRIGALQSVTLQGEETVDEVKLSCPKHFSKENKTCDLLVGERGPSVRLFSELNLKKVVHCRFLEEKIDRPQLETKNSNEREDHQENERHQENEGNQESKEHQESDGKEGKSPPVKSSMPLSVSMAHFLKAGVTVESTKKIVEVAVEEFDIHTMNWKDPVIGKFLVQKEEYDRDGFRMVHRCKCFGGDFPRGSFVVKSHIPEKILPESNESIEGQTRKSVQMHMLARYFSKCFVNDAPPDFGNSFIYSKSYYSTIDGNPVSIEPFLDGHFEKLINNNGLKTYIGTDSEYMEKAECFVHYTLKRSQDSVMVTDIQGVGYHLTDPEISSKNLRDENNEWTFGIDNHSLIGIGNFLEEHECNGYCKAYKL